MSFLTPTTWSAPGLNFALDLVAKATTLLVIGLIVQWVLARRRASLGSTAANACLIGLVVLPCSAVLLPAVNFAWLPAQQSRPASAVRTGNLTSSGHNRAVELDRVMWTQAKIYDHPMVESVREDTVTAMSNDGSRRSSTSGEAPILRRAASTPARSVDWIMIGLSAYVVVAMAMMARLLVSLVAAHRLRAASRRVAEGPWWLAMERCRRRLRINHAIGLRLSPEVNVPVVLGWIRPTIVLPLSFSAMDASDHADAVFLHELTHVRRRDYPWNVFLRLVQAVYWPHPLVWLLGRAMAETRERACDDLCVYELGGPTAYRETLVAVAQGMSHRASPALGLAMARPSRLGQRLARIEESRGDARCVPSAFARVMFALTAVAASLTLGVVQFNRAEARPIALVTVTQEPRADKPALPEVGTGRTFHLRVVAVETKKPIPDADVRIFHLTHDDWRTTDKTGGLDIAHSTGPADTRIAIDVWGDGRAMQRHTWGNNPNKPIPDGATIELQPGQSLGGVVQDEQGRPIAGATLFLWSHNYKRKDSHELLCEPVRRLDGRRRPLPDGTGEGG